MFTGTFTALVTPFRNDQFDEAAYEALIEAQIAEDAGGDLAAFEKRLSRGIADKDKASWKANLDPLTWANESLAHTIRIYQSLASNGPVIGDCYYRENIATVDAQLQKAGIRLAALLNQIAR